MHFFSSNGIDLVAGSENREKSWFTNLNKGTCYLKEFWVS